MRYFIKFMSKNQIKINYFLTAFLFVFSNLQLNASTSIEKVKQNGEEHIAVIERIFAKYTIAKKQKISFEKIKLRWNKNLKELDIVKKEKKSQTQKDTLTTYKMIKSSTKDVCSILAIYKRDLILNFKTRIENSKTDKYEYVGQYRVSMQEFTRAEKAFRDNHYTYAAHLYDRGITILLNIYLKLNLALPPAYANYKNLNIKKKIKK
ncbi:MAG: hypothetical protein OEZ22_10770 [Spirochaetia bacterium]|nr:hypothetical protein [Spirochaetia bacterium]